MVVCKACLMHGKVSCGGQDHRAWQLPADLEERRRLPPCPNQRQARRFFENIGVHPYQAQGLNEVHRMNIEKTASTPKVLAQRRMR
jgi:hypothetical protein